MIRDASGVSKQALPSLREARDLLVKLGAPRRLIQHAVLVGEAAELLIEGLRRMGVPLDADFVRLGAVLHDAGKTLHVQELSKAGHAHEQAGEKLLLREGIAPALARFCVSHARWDEPDVSFEELLVALADKLWKGKREPALEKRVIESVAEKRGCGVWDVFVELVS